MNIQTALRQRFKSPEYAYFSEVGDATGGMVRRHADGVAMSLWPSRGLEIIGIEIKVHRSDWLRELKNPEKAEAIFKFCDRWYLVSDEASARKEEIPPTWGWLCLKGTKLVEIVKAPKLEPTPLTRSFIAAILRRASESSATAEELKAARSAGFTEGAEDAKRIGQYERDGYKNQYERLIAEVEAFRKASGIELGRYSDVANLGKLVAIAQRLMNDGHRATTFDMLTNTADRVVDHATRVKQAIEEMRAACEPTEVSRA